MTIMKVQLSSRQKNVLPVLLFSISLLLGCFIGIQIGHADSPPAVSLSDSGVSTTGVVTANDFLLLNGSSIGPQSMPWANITSTNQQPYSYLIGVFSNSSYYAINGTTGQYVNSWTSTNVNTLFNNAIQSNTNVHVNDGTYSGVISISGKNNVVLTFSKGATLFVPNSGNAPALTLTNCNNWLIQNPTINGNAANQANAAGAGGLAMTENGIMIEPNSTNIHVDGANITNCGQWGFRADNDGNSTMRNIGITNSIITFCGWNGIGYSAGTIDGYIENNEIAYCGDVGIGTWGSGTKITHNYIHDMNGTAGYNNAHGGIGLESLLNYRPYGISNFVSENTINNTAVGIGLGLAVNNNTISQNTISNSATDAIYAASCNYNVFDGNIISNVSASGVGIWLYGGCLYSSIVNNHIADVGTSGNGYGIALNLASFSVVSGNYVSDVGYDGISVNGNNNKLSLNYIWNNVNTNFNVYGSNNLISQNQAWNTAADIHIESGASNTTVTGNNLYGASWQTIVDDGSNNIFSSESSMQPEYLGQGSVIGSPITVYLPVTVTAGQILCKNSTGYFLADGTSIATMPVVGMTIEAVSAYSNCRIITSGYIQNPAWNLVVGGAHPIYTWTGGYSAQTYLTGSGNVNQQIGYPVKNNTIYFNTNYPWVTHP
jgi:hypothetical protein